MKSRKVLAIGAHFDDVEIGCGGSIAKHVEAGDSVTIFVATHSGYFNHLGEEVRSQQQAFDEGHSAAKILGVDDLICGGHKTNDLKCTDELVCQIKALMEGKQIDTVYTHWEGDAHLDHAALAKASVSACRHTKRLFMYQSNQYAGVELFDGRFYVDISSVLDKKRRAIAAHISEYQRVGEPWVDKPLLSNKMQGAVVGAEYAECFQLVRYLQ
jgi:LmbE family N-acetylglucosaminyl deacetylase